MILDKVLSKLRKKKLFRFNYSRFKRELDTSHHTSRRNMYNEIVMKDDKFMIKVKGIRTKFSRITTGQGEDGPRKTNFRAVKMRVIPELCHNFKYPADLWLKAKVMPNILHHICILYHQMEKRRPVNGPRI